MFYVTSRVGSMFAVYDDTDNSVEWYDKQQLDNFINIGVEIVGYSKSHVRLVTSLEVPFNSCNWTKSKKNIFNEASRVSKSGDIITIYAEGKKYKCKLLDYSSYVCLVKFSNGLFVKIPTSYLNERL